MTLKSIKSIALCVCMCVCEQTKKNMLFRNNYLGGGWPSGKSTAVLTEYLGSEASTHMAAHI